jgi:GntR family transcriptional regulator, gluconate operon transcriptional repressor
MKGVDIMATETKQRTLRVGSLGDRLAEVLRERIIRGSLPAGEHLREEMLAAEFDVSRGPVRDAIAILHLQGLVESKRQGVEVCGLSETDLEEIYSLRTAIETLALQLAIERTDGNSGLWANAADLANKLIQAADARNTSQYAELDLSFHTEFYRLSQHKRLLSIWEQYRPIFSVILKITNEQDKDLQPSAKDHDMLLALAQRGDVASAKAVLSSHLQGSFERIRKVQSRLTPKPESVPGANGRPPKPGSL